jgi:hypothetical protein
MVIIAKILTMMHENDSFQLGAITFLDTMANWNSSNNLKAPYGLNDLLVKMDYF